MNPLEWKSKRSDVLIVVAIFILTAIGIHILMSLNGGRHDRTDSFDKFLKHLSNPGRFSMSIIISLIAYSPIYAFRFKVPRKIRIDLQKGLLIIQRRYMKKEQLIALQGIGYVYYQRSVFAILEIYHTFETPRGTFRKRFRTIMVPFWGMSINRSDLKEIISHLKEQGAMEEPEIQKRSLQDLIQE